MTRRATALAALGVLAAGALTLGVAAPAQAVETAGLRSYMLTVPPSVYSASAGYSAGEQVVYRDMSRNTPDKDDVYAPASPSSGWKVVGGNAAIWAGGTALLSAGGTLGTVFTVNPDQLEQRYAEQGLSDNDWWTQFNCERMGDDWLGSLANAINDLWTGLLGIDCDAARGDNIKKNPLFTPLANEEPGGIQGLPQLIVHTVFTDTRVTVGAPFWSTEKTAVTSDSPSRQEGWVYPIKWEAGSNLLQVAVRGLPSSGSYVTSSTYSLTPSTPATVQHVKKATEPRCAGATLCLVPSNLVASVETPPGLMFYVATASIGGTQTKTFGVPPYVDPYQGGFESPSADQVFLTTVTTADGNKYTCRTRAFKQTDTDVPKPCDPTIPAGEWEVSRVVEMIPATSTDWVSGSDPRRIMTENETPQEYRNWRTAFPACATQVCLMDLRSPAGSCFDQGDACNGWMSDPDKVGKYTCTYSGQTISLSECEAAYPNVFDKTAREQGQAYPQPSGAPATSAPIQTSTSPAPVTSPGSWPANPEGNRNCFPTGWNVFNPVEWVYKPVRCALEWAFVPRQSYVDNVMGNMRFVWTSSSLVSLLGVLADGADMFLGPAGCEGPAVNLNIYGSSYSGHPLSACGEPFASAASFSFIFTGVAAWVMAVASIARSIAGVVAFKGIGGDNS